MAMAEVLSVELARSDCLADYNGIDHLHVDQLPQRRRQYRFDRCCAEQEARRTLDLCWRDHRLGTIYQTTVHLFARQGALYVEPSEDIAVSLSVIDVAFACRKVGQPFVPYGCPEVSDAIVRKCRLSNTQYCEHNPVLDIMPGSSFGRYKPPFLGLLDAQSLKLSSDFGHMLVCGR